MVLAASCCLSAGEKTPALLLADPTAPVARVVERCPTWPVNDCDRLWPASRWVGVGLVNRDCGSADPVGCRADAGMVVGALDFGGSFTDLERVGIGILSRRTLQV
jgi:hypothetical protein